MTYNPLAMHLVLCFMEHKTNLSAMAMQSECGSNDFPFFPGSEVCGRKHIPHGMG